MLINFTELNGGVIMEPVIGNTIDKALQGLKSFFLVISASLGVFCLGTRYLVERKKMHIGQGFLYCISATP